MTYSAEKTLPVSWLEEKHSSYYNTTPGIRTSGLLRLMIMSKKVLRSYALSHIYIYIYIYIYMCACVCVIRHRHRISWILSSNSERNHKTESIEATSYVKTCITSHESASLCAAIYSINSHFSMRVIHPSHMTTVVRTSMLKTITGYIYNLSFNSCISKTTLQAKCL